MISVMNNDFNFDRNPNPYSRFDLSVFSMDSPNENHVSTDPPTESQDLDESTARVRVSTGDMVWGKVKSHPWWPGHIYNESFASSSVRRTKSEGFCLVAFFGDSSYGWFDPTELIPYEPNFVEKTKQTTQKSFIKALDESIDEMSRRAALGISCRCRNPYNFRPARVPNYYEVDVVGYERNGIYSRKQIVKEREGFEPGGVVGFLKRLAVDVSGMVVIKDADWYRNMAVGLALRRAMFEEFDETYAQAFGQQPVRPVRDEMGVLEQAESFAPRVAPLSGPLVIAEALGSYNKKRYVTTKHFSSSSSKDKEKSVSTKKKRKKEEDKYVLKRRRDEHHVATPAAVGSSSFLPVAYSSTSSASEYVLQRREPHEDTKPNNFRDLFSVKKPNIEEEEEEEEGKEEDKEEEEPRTPPLPLTLSDNNIVLDEKPMAVVSAIKDKKVKKRPLDDVINGISKQSVKIKKKRRKTLASPDEAEAPPHPPRPVSPPPIDADELAQLQLQDVIAAVKSLALDPFFGVKRNAPLITRHILLRFRSLVYSKSLVLPSPDETSNTTITTTTTTSSSSSSIAPPPPPPPPPSNKEPEPELEPKPEPAKFIKRSADLTKSGRKRAPSDRQEEKSEKRIKKITTLKTLAAEKKSSADVAAPPPAPEPEKKKLETAQKQKPQPPQLPLPPSPTYLIMKFPPRSTLPSVANLKARFARFGPLEVDSTRVFWKSHSCKVLFKHKSDAVKAYSFVKTNDIFGQIQVDYSIREVEAAPSEPEPLSRPVSIPASASLPVGRLKSILKKPSGGGGGGDEATKENPNQRVKFVLSGKSNDSHEKVNSPPKSPPLVVQPKPTAFPASVRPMVATPARSCDPRPQNKNNVDISHQMLSLLLRCNDIVAGLKNLPGFVPYRPL